MILELLAGEHGIHAVPFRAGRPLDPIALPDGAIVEMPTDEQRWHVKDGWNSLLGLDAGKAVPDSATDYDPCGYTYIKCGGVYLLPSGQVAAVYGCQAVDLGAD